MTKKGKILSVLGNMFIFVSVLFLILTFAPALKEEIVYQVKQVAESSIVPVEIKKKDLTPENTNFWITIPKIEASAPVFPNIDTQDKDKYLPILYKGVAHAEGSSLPGKDGNTYLFAHSTDAFFNVGHYNAVFYLLGKLNAGDEIKVFYEGEEILYVVRERKIVEPEDVKYLGKINNGKTLTLQTCYPPGTTAKRLIVIADQVE